MAKIDNLRLTPAKDIRELNKNIEMILNKLNEVVDALNTLLP